VRIYSEMRDRLALEYDLDDETLRDTLEGETDLQEQILRLCRLAIDAETLAEGAQARIRDMMARKKRFEDKSARLRSIALWAMEESGLKKIVASDATVSVGAPRPSLQITDEHELPPHLTSITIVPDKRAIKACIEAGEEIPGARLSNSPPSLIIRTK